MNESLPTAESPSRQRGRWIGLGLALALWLGLIYLWLSASHLDFLPGWVVRWTQQIVFTIPAVVSLVAAWRVRKERTLRRSLVNTLAFLFTWPALVFTLDHLGWPEIRANVAMILTGAAFFIGLAWSVWWVDRAARRLARERTAEKPKRIWNPLDTDAWYYGRSRKLNQSLSTFLAYCLMFLLMAVLILNLQGCGEVFEKPFGGGEDQPMVQQVQIKKVKKKEYVINPLSSIVFTPPPIEKIELQLLEVTKHYHTPGYGSADGAGFATGTREGKLRFIRLEYGGGNWNNRVAADTIMLTEYAIRWGATDRVAEKAETRTIGQLGRADRLKSPAFVYINGSRGIRLSQSEIETLRDYILERHGMIFADASSSQFHNEFLAVMRQVLPNVRPVPIPLDDGIHMKPWPVAFQAYVTPHGGKEALGWRVDGRWAVYYHPGDLGDAWADDHAGVPARVYKACYDIGANVIFYANREHSIWQEAQEQQRK